jgi:dihydrolipoamide dehydrogenase
MELKVSGHKADFNAVVKRSRDVAEKMSGGVQFLMKKNKIDVIMGTGKVNPGKQIEVTDKGVKTILTAVNI